MLSSANVAPPETVCAGKLQKVLLEMLENCHLHERVAAVDFQQEGDELTRDLLVAVGPEVLRAAVKRTGDELETPPGKRQSVEDTRQLLERLSRERHNQASSTFHNSAASSSTSNLPRPEVHLRRPPRAPRVIDDSLDPRLTVAVSPEKMYQHMKRSLRKAQCGSVSPITQVDPHAAHFFALAVESWLEGLLGKMIDVSQARNSPDAKILTMDDLHGALWSEWGATYMPTTFLSKLSASSSAAAVMPRLLKRPPFTFEEMCENTADMDSDALDNSDLDLDTSSDEGYNWMSDDLEDGSSDCSGEVPGSMDGGDDDDPGSPPQMEIFSSV